MYLEGCHEKALEFVTMDQLQQYALQGEENVEGGTEQAAAPAEQL